MDSSQVDPSQYLGWIFALGGVGIVISVIGLVLYFVPWLVALKVKHPNTLAIFFLNLLLGWSLIGWAAALVWALIKPQTPPIQYVYNLPPGAMPPDGPSTAAPQTGRVEPTLRRH